MELSVKFIQFYARKLNYLREGVDGLAISFFFFGSAVCDALCSCILEALGFCNPEVVGKRLMFALNISP